MSLRKKTLNAAFWSVFQSWFVKFFSLLLFFMLAWFLNPEEFGTAAAIVLLLSFVTILVEQGIPSAIIQHKEISDEKLTFPFLLSVVTALLISFVMLFYPSSIAQLLSVDGIETYIQIAAIAPIFLCIKGFQTGLLQRQLNFKVITKITIFATLLSGGIAIAMAMFGMGALSIIIQLIVFNILIALYLWWISTWRPSFSSLMTEGRALLSFSGYIFLSRLVDFFSQRTVDFIVLAKFGVTGLGIFAVSSKLYLTVIELLSASLFPVLLSAFSKMQDEIEQLKLSYLRLIYISGCLMFPVFILLAICSSHIEQILFDEKWAGIAELMEMLFLLGGVLVVQYFNGSVITAIGGAKQILYLNIAKLISAVAVLSIAPIDSLLELVLYFVISQVVVTPLVFYTAMTLVKASFVEVITALMPGLFYSIVSYYLVSQLMLMETFADMSVFLSALITVLAFSAVYTVMLLLFSGARLKSEMRNFMVFRE